MLKTIIIAAFAGAVLSASAAQAEVVTCNRFGCSDWQQARSEPVTAKTAKKVRRHRTIVRATDANGNGLVAIHASNGKSAKVAARYARQFQGFLNDLEAEGYRIDFIGGWRRFGSCRGCDAHPAGRAIDVNQTARNRVTRKLPADVTRIAARHGLCHGAIWNRPDRGHFEIASASRATSCREIANRHWPRLVQKVSTP